MNTATLQSTPPLRTAARQQLERARDLFLEQIADRPPDQHDPEWLERQRADAARVFEQEGLPTSKHEDWKHTSLAALGRLALRPGSAVIATDKGASALPQPPIAAAAEVLPLAEAVVGVADAERYLGRVAQDSGRPFTALNSALWRDGVLIRIPGEGAPSALRLHIQSGSQGEPEAVHPRVLIVAEPGSRLTLLIDHSHSNAGPGLVLTNTVIEVVAAEGSEVELIQLVRPAASAFHIGSLYARLGREARVNVHSFVLGSALARSDVELLFADTGSAATVNGLLLAAAGETADAHTFLEHRAEHTKAEELYKAVVTAGGHGVFHGRITIRPGAQHTDARQTSRNLLLHETARMDARPQLEILADDVRCVHGGAIGQLDEEALFYLRTRGIGAEAARALLVEAFAREVIGRVPLHFREQVESAVMPRLRVLGRDQGEVAS